MLGYGNEWEEMKDSEGNVFYRNVLTSQCQWDKPLDAVKVSATEKFCTAYKNKNRSIVQKWLVCRLNLLKMIIAYTCRYSCEECNRSWNASSEGAKTLLKLCEPCVFRCHKTHKGVRLIRTSAASCNCLVVCKVSLHNHVCCCPLKVFLTGGKLCL